MSGVSPEHCRDCVRCGGMVPHVPELTRELRSVVERALAEPDLTPIQRLAYIRSAVSTLAAEIEGVCIGCSALERGGRAA